MQILTKYHKIFPLKFALFKTKIVMKELFSINLLKFFYFCSDFLSHQTILVRFLVILAILWSNFEPFLNLKSNKEPFWSYFWVILELFGATLDLILQNYSLTSLTFLFQKGSRPWNFKQDYASAIRPTPRVYLLNNTSKLRFLVKFSSFEHFLHQK